MPLLDYIHSRFTPAFKVEFEEEPANQLFYVVRTVDFGIKLYNDQRNAQIFYLFIYLLLPYMFRDFFKPIFKGRCTN
jgi:hypothetical protein